MKVTGELGEFKEWKACDTTLHIGHLFGPNVYQMREIFTVKAQNRRSDDKEEKQAKKDYYEASDSVLQTGFLVGSNRFQREFHRKSSRMRLWWKAPKNMVKTKIWRRVKCCSEISWFFGCIFTIRV